PIDSLGSVPTFFNVSVTASPAFTRNNSLSNFIWSLDSTVMLFETSTFSMPGTVSVSTVSEEEVVSVVVVVLLFSEPPQAANDNARATAGKTNNFFMLILKYMCSHKFNNIFL